MKLKINMVGVVGCGIMGGGIAQVAAVAGYQVVVSEINKPLLNAGINQIKKNLYRNLSKGKFSQYDLKKTIASIRGSTDIKDFSDCDLVIEAAVEKLELKRSIFSRLDRVCKPDVILATNTSCLSIADIASATSRSDQVVGLHFFNPVPMMRLVEVIQTLKVDPTATTVARDFAESLGKTVVEVPDVPGFIVNRLSNPFILHAIRILQDGIADAPTIDAGISFGLNHPMGPLALADLVGLDTVLFIADALYADLKDTMYVAPTLLRKMVAAGRLGKKTGHGFYEYG